MLGSNPCNLFFLWVQHLQCPCTASLSVAWASPCIVTLGLGGRADSLCPYKGAVWWHGGDGLVVGFNLRGLFQPL